MQISWNLLSSKRCLCCRTFTSLTQCLLTLCIKNKHTSVPDTVVASFSPMRAGYLMLGILSMLHRDEHYMCIAVRKWFIATKFVINSTSVGGLLYIYICRCRCLIGGRKAVSLPLHPVWHTFEANTYSSDVSVIYLEIHNIIFAAALASKVG